MTAETLDQKGAVINTDFFGFVGPYPTPGNDLSTLPNLLHLGGLYPLEAVALATNPAKALDGDILMEYAPKIGGQIFTSKGDLVRDLGLKTAVLISLLTDRVATITDTIPDNTGNRRGWWADPELGSKLWLLFRSKFTIDLPSKIEAASREALNWMLEEGVASNIIVTAQRTDLARVDWTIQIIKPGSKDSDNFTFFFNWNNEIFGEVP